MLAAVSTVPRYSDMPYVRPDLAAIERLHRARLGAWDAAGTAQEQIAVLREWDRARVELDTMRNLAHLRFEMDVRDPAAKAEKEFFDDAGPKLAEWGLEVLRKILASPHRAELDRLYDELVQLRHAMATKLGHDSFTSLAYVLMRRDYTPDQVAAYRQQVRDVVVPLASRIRKRHAESLGVTDYAFHDASVRDALGVPRPMGGHDWMLDRAGELFARFGDDFSDFWALMRDRQLLDLESREGKAGGGFCTDLARWGVPFVFANFNGTEDDVNVFTHECGHAFQAWRSMALPLCDYYVPTFDAAEIHSMGLEMLSHPHVDLFFGDDAARYRAGHLEKAVLFLPYGVAIDEFQHRVYADPGMSPRQRAEAWRDLEATYLPERKYPGMPFAQSGRFWQVQRHVYLAPFYYIDYCLAQTCALQFWQLAERDRSEAMAAYRRICDIGGSKPFSGIVEAAGLASPFASGTIARLASSLEPVLLG